jgi:hypothetical protein
MQGKYNYLVKIPKMGGKKGDKLPKMEGVGEMLISMAYDLFFIFIL